MYLNCDLVFLVFGVFFFFLHFTWDYKSVLESNVGDDGQAERAALIKTRITCLVKLYLRDRLNK